jgi:hypothetical protein
MPEAAREVAVARLLEDRPELVTLLQAEQERTALERHYFSSSGEYTSTTGDPDLYVLFCQRYSALLRHGGKLGVVLPRTAFVNEGSEGFRRWLFEENTADRIDLLVNTRRWAFDMKELYTISLTSAIRMDPDESHSVEVAGVASSPSQWEEQVKHAGLRLPPHAFGPGWIMPLLRTQAETDLLAKLRMGRLFPHGPEGRWQCFPTLELHESNDRALWRGAREGLPLWKGESFDQYDAHGAEARVCPASENVLARVRKTRPGTGSILADELSVNERRAALLEELKHACVAFRGVGRSRDSRTIIACLVPPRIFLAHSAPYLTFTRRTNLDRAACLAMMNSLAFDWQARRFVEVNISFFILEGLVVPDLEEQEYERIARCAARLSSVDNRFTDFAEDLGVEIGPLSEEAQEDLRLEIDARVARAWGLTKEDLDVLLADFSPDSVPPSYREKFHERLADLG